MSVSWKFFPLLIAVLACAVSCGDIAKSRRTVRSVGAETLRSETLAVCRAGFASGAARKIESTDWPQSVRSFQPLGLWAEPDGAYLLLESDADGERGVYLPRILTEKDPLCTAALTHEKLAAGVYWYDRKRS